MTGIGRAPGAVAVSGRRAVRRCVAWVTGLLLTALLAAVPAHAAPAFAGPAAPSRPARHACDPGFRGIACRCRAGEVRPEDLPMIAAEALVAGLATPLLCELAGWPRTADPRDIREAFEQALAGSGDELPDPGLAQRHALRRLAEGLVDGEIAPIEW